MQKLWLNLYGNQMSAVALINVLFLAIRFPLKRQIMYETDMHFSFFLKLRVMHLPVAAFFPCVVIIALW